jgi:hypothetical protein
MLIPFFLTIIAGLINLSFAFNGISPSYVNEKNSYFVSEVKVLPAEFSVHQKQQTLIATNTSAYKSSNLVASSTVSIQTETMTAGMTYLYASQNNEAYSVNITLNAKDYPVLIDTGSPYLWLYSSNCTANSCKGKELFNAERATQLNGTFALNYDSGTASGLIYKDSIIIGGYETQNFEFGVADEVPDLFQKYEFSGVLGLPADNASITGLVNAVSFLSENGDISQSKFTICMGNYDSDEVNDGLLFLGSTKDILHNGEIYTSPIIHQAVSHWEIKIDSVYVNDYQISFPALQIDNEISNISRIGLLDSGTTSLVLSTSDANIIHSFFKSSITDGQNYAILCNSTLNFEFEISGKNWTLTPEMYIGSEYPVDSTLHGYCVSNIQGIDSTNDGAWILGILFMQNKYVEFDYENQWIGLAERNNNIKFVNPPSNNTNSVISTPSTTLITSTTELSQSSTSIAKTSNSISQHSNIANNYHNSFINCWIYGTLSILYFTNLY